MKRIIALMLALLLCFALLVSCGGDDDDGDDSSSSVNNPSLDSVPTDEEPDVADNVIDASELK